MSLTRVFAQYVLGLSYETLDAQTVALAKETFADTIGCLLAGAREIPVELAARYADAASGLRTATALGRAERYDMEHAALLNGIAAHVHDFDDQLGVMNGHPSAPVVPAVLAVGEQLHSSGAEILAAYIAGVQVCYLLSLAFNRDDRYYSKGWHTTSTFGVFAAAAAAGWLYGLTEEQMVNALGIAASESGGLKGNFGTMTKSLHAGRAAQKGIFCAQLARLGYRSNPDIMEVNEGFASVSVGNVDLEDVLAAIKSGKTAFTGPGLNIKAWPCCKQNHSAIHSLQALMKQYGFTAQQIDEIHCRVQPVSYDCLKYHAPTTTLQGKFSLQYNLALTALHGTVVLEDFNGTDIQDAEVLTFLPKVRMSKDASIGGGKYNDGTFSSIVEVRLKDGQTYSAHTIAVKGDAANRMSREELDEKFMQCARRSVDAKAIPAIRQLLETLETQEDICRLIETINEASLAGGKAEER